MDELTRILAVIVVLVRLRNWSEVTMYVGDDGG